jgi:hypothetical protein
MVEIACGTRRRTGRWGALLALASGAVLAAAEADLQRLEAVVTQLVAVRKAAHEAETAWAEQRPAVEGRLAVLRQQQAAAGAALAAAQQAAAEAATRRQTLEAHVAQAEAALATLVAPTRAAEVRLRALLPRLPEPLTTALAQQVKDLPPAEIEIAPETLQDRLRLVFGLLTEIDQFAAGVHLLRQTLTDPAGVVREMDVVYLGLGTAFAASASAPSAAIGRPGPTGWTWRWEDGLGAAVREAVASYRKERPAGFIVLPLELGVQAPQGGTP